MPKCQSMQVCLLGDGWKAICKASGIDTSKCPGIYSQGVAFCLGKQIEIKGG